MCPRGCLIAPGKRGFCFVRRNVEGTLISTTYGRSTGFCIDPIEKKPLNQFYPGTPILSFGTAGCNLACVFCQNWTSSRSREVAGTSATATPEAIAEAALDHGCKSVAFTYNDPIIWAEYAIDTAKACHERGIQAVAVTNGYIGPSARAEFFRHMDAANIDLKAFSERFYRELTQSSLQPVLDTLEYVANETDVWIELTNLIIPGDNDDTDEIARMCDWIVTKLGPDVPVHFTAFHPDFKMLDHEATPLDTLVRAYEVARSAGLRYPYTGNVHDPRRQSTYCPDCGAEVIRRAGYEPVAKAFKAGICTICGYRIAGRFDEEFGNWGSRRQPVRISEYAHVARTPRESSPRVSPEEGTQPMASNPQSNESAAALAVAEAPALTPEQEKAVFDAAARWMTEAAYRLRPSDADPGVSEIGGTPVIGAFVTAKRNGRLRSCCGFMGRPVPLIHAVSEAAIRTATDDPRFPPLSPSELPHLDVDVWLLYGMEPVAAKGEDRIDAVEVGRHGLQIARRGQSGLLLPGVAVELGLDSRGFLEQVCMKAGLARDAWMDHDTVLFTFEGKEIKAPYEPGKWVDPAKYVPAGLSARDAGTLAEFCRRNLLALVQGATPSYYLAGAYDGDVLGVTLAIQAPEGGAKLELSKLGLKQPIPLQATLFELVQAAANTIQRQPVSDETLYRLQVSMAVFTDAALHGTLAEPDLAGIDPARRAVALFGPHGWAWSFDAEADCESLLAAAAEVYGEHAKDANVVSFAFTATAPSMTVSNVPKATGARPPAVAGTFYPARRGEIEESLANMIPAGAKKETFSGALIPHAGWTYSGRLAADVLSRIRYPSLAVAFCPRHRPGGSRWAVCPYDSWTIPTGSVPSDPAFAKTLAERIEHLQSDPVAHRGEHAIEVALPMIARLAPKTKVVGIAMSGGTWEELERFAEEFSEILRPMEERPLLIISTDMNHFADDAQTRRLDRLALDALEALDPKRLFETVMEHRISMCGIHGACVVLETLRRLGALHECRTVGYATSADTTKDTSRVVGYAGMLFK